MFKRLKISLQYLVPQHLLSSLMRRLADSPSPWLKNRLINHFIKHYSISMDEAEISDPECYPTFNSFFIRQLKAGIRPIDQSTHGFVAPVDGVLTQFGKIKNRQLLQVKGSYFDLEHLLGEKTLANAFDNGEYGIFYLSPNHYHRIHMPFSGKLIQSLFIPGKLFSVSPLTSQYIPNLFSRNERLVTVFETDHGLMSLVLVGAMIVGSIQTSWRKTPYQAKEVRVENVPPNLYLRKGEELGFFNVGGSSVITLMQEDKLNWSPSLLSNSEVRYGQLLGETTVV